jgi:hypothetical protein
MDDIPSQLSAWRVELERELLALEQQIGALRTAATAKREKIAAIDRLLGANQQSATVDLSASADESEDDAITTPGSAYWRPILTVLVELGGRGRRRKVIELVGAKMKDTFTPADHNHLPSHGTRWRTRVTFQASHMRRVAGLIRNDSPRGVWEISDAGRDWLNRQALH